MDHFEASISGFRDCLPYSPGCRKCESTCTRYVKIAVRFAAWAREQGRASFAEVTKADLRGYLATAAREARRRGGRGH